MAAWVALAFIAVAGEAPAQTWTACSGSNSSAANCNTGPVAVGTTSAPQTTLDVAGYLTIRSAGRLRLPTAAFSNYAEIYSPTSEGTGASPIAFNVGAGEAMRITNGGNVGIGTTTPGQKLSVAGSIESATSGTASLLVTSGNGTTSPRQAYVQMTSNEPSSHNWQVGMIGGAGEFVIRDVAVTPAVARMTIDTSGDATFSGTVTGNTIKATYQDVAEWVPASETLTAATVVVLDPERTNHVLRSTKPYDTSAAGVVSARPGIQLGERGAASALIATTGRVKVKADASHGAIHIGDLLVTGTLPGTAMRSEPVDIGGVKIHRPGTVIGKALEPLDHGTGEILVLLSLQ